MKHYQFYQNRECEFFPCHSGVDAERFSCIFCYCPLYPLGAQCDGNYSYTKRGIKDCSGCIKPHLPECYSEIVEALDAVIDLVKKKDQEQEKP